MENTFSKVGHRNYAVVDETSLSEEEKEAVKMAREFHGIMGAVPMSYQVVDSANSTIFYGRVHHAMGYTIVLDENKKVRFIQKGSLTEDQVSLLNKGVPKEAARGRLKYLIFLIQESMR